MSNTTEIKRRLTRAEMVADEAVKHAPPLCDTITTDLRDGRFYVRYVGPQGLSGAFTVKAWMRRADIGARLAKVVERMEKWR